MYNKKVYLAKSNLASGLDFEYVKSNLLRIPDIEIIEYGDGFEPSECACLVYIPEPLEKLTEVIEINKSVSIAINSYLSTNDSNGVFIYIGSSTSGFISDVETTSPYVCPFDCLTVANEESWDKHSLLGLNDSIDENLCHIVSLVIEAGNRWTQNPRHYKQKKGYCMPPIPTVEERRSRGTKGHYISDEVGKFPHYPKQKMGKARKFEEEEEYNEKPRERYSNIKSRRRI